MKYFIPLLDNGDGSVKASFMTAFIAAFGGTEIHVARVSDSHPGRARNRAAAAFLKSDCTHLLFVDADIIFTRDDVQLLNASDEPLIGGMYPKKISTHLEWCLVSFPENCNKAIKAGELMEVRRTGTGFLRIAREVLETVKGRSDRYENHGQDEWDFFESGVWNKEWLSEDWYFCDKARRAGYRVMIHTGIQLRHEGTFIYPPAPDRLQWCPPNMRHHIERIWQGEYWFKGSNPKTVLDIGANIGGFALWAREIWPGCTVESYEPHPENCRIFEMNTRGTDGVKLHEVGVSSEAGEFDLYEGVNIGQHSFHHCPEGKKAVSAIVVPAGSLKSAEFVKIDTEGCEMEILSGLDLTETRWIALEYHRESDKEAVRGFLSAKGYAEWEHEEIEPDRGILKFLRA